MFLLMCVMQDIEFTVQESRLWMLQCRTGKRTGKSAVKIAVDMVNEGLVERRAAIKMVEPGHLDQLLHPQVIYRSRTMDVRTKGLPNQSLLMPLCIDAVMETHSLRTRRRTRIKSLPLVCQPHLGLLWARLCSLLRMLKHGIPKGKLLFW